MGPLRNSGGSRPAGSEQKDTALTSPPPVVQKAPPLPPRWERTQTQFDDWAAAVTERADPFMAWLGLLFALLVGYEIAIDLDGGVATAFELASWVIWGIFAFEFATKLWLAPSRIGYLRQNWWQPALLLLPFLRVVSFCVWLAPGGRYRHRG